MLTFAGAIVLIAALGAEPAPTPSPAAGGLPEIGRVRSATPACTVMRDLVIPSFAAARRADARFAETRKRLPDWGELAADAAPDDPMRQSALAKLDADATKLLGEALVINRALGDPRLAADSTDPVVREERRELQQLYDTQKTRANILWEYVMRKNIAMSKAQFAPDPTIGGRTQPAPQNDDDKPNRGSRRAAGHAAREPHRLRQQTAPRRVGRRDRGRNPRQRKRRRKSVHPDRAALHLAPVSP